MNVALFASAFYPSLGGVEELVRQLAHANAGLQNPTMVLTNRWPKNLVESETYEGIPIRRYAFRVPERTPKQMAGWLLYGNATRRSIAAQLKEYQTTVIHVECVSSNAYYALMAKRDLGLPLVVSLQGELNMDATALFQRSAFARKLFCDVLSAADMITACSKQTLAEAEEFVGMPFLQRGRVIYNGIRLADFTGVEPNIRHRPYILGIGRHVRQKGFDVLIQAFAKIVQSGEISHDLLIAGDGPELDNLKNFANELEIERYVHFPGRLDRSAAVSYFLGCSFFVLPSRHEPMGIVNLEAMAANKAVIATKVGGVPELVDNGVNGFLVPPEDSDAIAEAAMRLIKENDLRIAMGNAGRQKALTFDWPMIAAQYLETYEEAVRLNKSNAV